MTEPHKHPLAESQQLADIQATPTHISAELHNLKVDHNARPREEAGGDAGAGKDTAESRLELVITRLLAGEERAEKLARSVDRLHTKIDEQGLLLNLLRSRSNRQKHEAKRVKQHALHYLHFALKKLLGRITDAELSDDPLDFVEVGAWLMIAAQRCKVVEGCWYNVDVVEELWSITWLSQYCLRRWRSCPAAEPRKENLGAIKAVVQKAIAKVMALITMAEGDEGQKSP
ncbi:hypothetical protein LTR85_001504 [Meristemomyces frigidus]|nr:hypothetical protein LTR85_001504 [Meristemomyces frigidus]